MSEPKTTAEVGHWALMNLLRCEKEIQISVVSKILQGFKREQIDQALNMSGVVESGDLISRSLLIEQIHKSKDHYEGFSRFGYSAGLEKAAYLTASLGKKQVL